MPEVCKKTEPKFETVNFSSACNKMSVKVIPPPLAAMQQPATTSAALPEHHQHDLTLTLASGGVCSHCQFRSSDPTLMLVHCVLQHLFRTPYSASEGGSSPYSCQLCGARADSPGRLDEHIHSEHLSQLAIASAPVIFGDNVRGYLRDRWLVGVGAAAEATPEEKKPEVKSAPNGVHHSPPPHAGDVVVKTELVVEDSNGSEEEEYIAARNPLEILSDTASMVMEREKELLPPSRPSSSTSAPSLLRSLSSSVSNQHNSMLQVPGPRGTKRKIGFSPGSPGVRVVVCTPDQVGGQVINWNADVLASSNGGDSDPEESTLTIKMEEMDEGEVAAAAAREENHHCPVCLETVGSAGGVDGHVKSAHGRAIAESVLYECNRCNSRHENKAEAALHLQKVHGISKELLLALEGGGGIISANGAADGGGDALSGGGGKRSRPKGPQHREVATLYRCLLCPAAYSTVQFTKDHILDAHSQATPYACSVCPESFSSRSKKNSHERKHKR